MPHIRVLFPESPEMRNFLREHKPRIRVIVAESLGYPLNDVALIPAPISPEDVELAENILPLELVVDSGTRAFGKEDACAELIRREIVEECPGADAINFGVWIVSHGQNGFVEHMPKK